MTLEYVNHLPCDDVPLSSGFVGFPFHHLFSDADPKEHRCHGLKCVANAAASLALCKHCIAFLCPFNVVQHRHECEPNLQRILDFARSDTSEYASGCQEWKHMVTRAK